MQYHFNRRISPTDACGPFLTPGATPASASSLEAATSPSGLSVATFEGRPVDRGVGLLRARFALVPVTFCAPLAFFLSRTPCLHPRNILHDRRSMPDASGLAL
jgi:hypothetical protein